MSSPENLYKEAFQVWEKATAQSMEQLLRNKEFLAFMGKAIESSTTLKAQIEQGTTASLKAMQIPTREDQIKILHKLTALEGRLTDLEDKLDQILSLLQRSSAPEEKSRQGEVSLEGL